MKSFQIFCFVLFCLLYANVSDLIQSPYFKVMGPAGEGSSQGQAVRAELKLESGERDSSSWLHNLLLNLLRILNKSPFMDFFFIISSLKNKTNIKLIGIKTLGNSKSSWTVGTVMFPNLHNLENFETRHCSYYILKSWIVTIIMLILLNLYYVPGTLSGICLNASFHLILRITLW